MSTLHERLLARIDRSDEHRLIASWNAVRAVVELHAPTDVVFVECAGCDLGIFAAAAPGWPCSTIKIIAAQLGVETGETP